MRKLRKVLAGTVVAVVAPGVLHLWLDLGASAGLGPSTRADACAAKPPAGSPPEPTPSGASRLEPVAVRAGVVAAPQAAMTGGAGNDALLGTPAGDRLVGGNGNDFADGRGGDDDASGGHGNDRLWGGDGEDRLKGQEGDDTLEGGPGDDQLQAHGDDDRLLGGPGADVLAAGPGDDTLRGGPGADVAEGGPGGDTFLLPSACEVAPGERLEGGPGHDRLLSPLSLAQLQLLGVELASIEELVLEPDPCSGRGHCVEDDGKGAVTCECDPGFAGPACALECTAGLACEVEAYENANGSVLALAAHDTALFTVADSASSDSVLGELSAWVAAHPAAFGFAPLGADDLELATAAALPPLSAGGLTVHQYVQRYRGNPVFGTDSLVKVTSTPAGVMALSGTLVDPHATYSGLSAPVPPAEAAVVLEQALEEAVGQDVTLGPLTLTAFPRQRAMGYVAGGFVGPLGVGQGAVAAERSESGDVELLFVSALALFTIDNQSPISVRAESDASDPLDPNVEDAPAASLRDGSPLTGADEGTSFRLAHPSVFLRDMSGSTAEDYFDDLITAPSFSSADSSFDAAPGTLGFMAQDSYRKALGLLGTTGTRLEGRWDSLLKEASDFLPGTFTPRVLVTLGASPSSCAGVPACAHSLNVLGGLDDFDHQPSPVGALEPLGRFALHESHTAAQLTHEFGHIVDLFVAAGWPEHGVTCWPQPGCTPSCEPGTSEEAPPVQETVANLYGIWALPALFDGIDATDCDTLPALSKGDDTSPHNSICRPDGEDFELFAPILEPGYKLNATGESLPTGGCGTEAGYRTDAAFQAWWELQTGQVCSPVAPYDCASFEAALPATLPAAAPNGLGGRAPNAAIDSLLYSLRVNSSTYEMLFDSMAAYYGCNYGPAAHQAFCDVFEHHGIIQCDALPVCQVCGNTAQDPGEECDDGNGSNTDACLSTCENASCGDGFPWAGVEECDDGNGADTDACLPTCEDASCGDGFLWAGVEECDDGNLADGDGCESDCTLQAVCGDGVLEGTEECDGDDLGGESCETLGAGAFGTLTCTAGCTLDTALCADCEPGTPGCRCLQTELAGEENPDLREDGILGNGKYCLDDVSLGGDVRCLENADATDTCHSCTVGEGVWCPCIPQEGCLLGDLDGPATGDPGDMLFCAAACTPGFEDACDALPAGGFGYCFAAGVTPEEGGMPDWFPDQYCRNVDSTFTCVQQLGQAALCMPGPGPVCTLEP